MLNLKPEMTDKSKYKNSPQVALRRKLFRVVLIALIILSLILAWRSADNTALSGSTAPVIDRVVFVREYAEDGELTIHINVHFHDLEGDISHLEIEISEVISIFGVIIRKDVYGSPGQQRSGTMISSWFTCDSYPITVDIRAIDMMGNQGATFHERVRCFSSQPLPTHWTSDG